MTGKSPAAVISLLFLIAATLLCSCGDNSTQHSILNSGMPAVFSDIQDLLNGVNKFIQKISSITQVMGFSTIVLLFVVLLLSAGMSAVGFPRGKATFLIALALSDSLWIFWKQSFGAQIPDYIIPMVRSNAILLTPLAVIILLKKLAPMLSGLLRRGAYRISGRKAAMDRGELRLLSKRIFHENTALYDHINESLNNGGEKIMMTGETRERLKEIRRLLDKLENKNNRIEKKSPDETP